MRLQLPSRTLRVHPSRQTVQLIREARNGIWEEYAWLCYENRYLTLEQMAAQMLECESFTKFSMTLYETFKQKSQMESHRTVAIVFVDVDGLEHRDF